MFGITASNIFLYFLFPIAVIAISIYLLRSKEVTFGSYFFANNSIHWFYLGVSFFTSSIIGPAIISFAYPSLGIIFLILYLLFSVIMLILYSRYLFPKLKSGNFNSIKGYFDNRFGNYAGFIVSGIFVLSNILRLLIVLSAGSLIISQISGVDVVSSLLFFIIISGIYIIVGGIHADIYGDVIHTIVIIFGTAILFLGFTGSNNAGGINTTLLFNNIVLNDFSLIGVLFSIPIIAFGFWFSEYLIIQKSLCINDNFKIKKAVYTAGFLQIIPLLLFAFLLTSGIGGLKSVTNMFFINEETPEVIKLILIMSISAVIISLIANLITSLSSIITLDFIKIISPETSERKLVLAGRFSAISVLFICIAVIPFSSVQNFNSVITLFGILSYIASFMAAFFIISFLSIKIKPIIITINTIIISILIIIRSLSDIKIISIKIGLLDWFFNIDLFHFTLVIFLMSLSAFLFSAKADKTQSIDFSVKEDFVSKKMANLK